MTFLSGRDDRPGLPVSPVRTLILVAESPLIRRGLRALLAGRRLFAVVGESDGATEAIRQLEALRPDVLVVDLPLPSPGAAIELIRAARHRSPAVRIVALSAGRHAAMRRAATAAGADAVLPHAEVPERLPGALAGAHAEGVETPAPRPAGATFFKARLTTREWDVLGRAAAGLTCPAIAAQLGISRRTVELHRANLMRKLGVHNQTELVRHAIAHGLIPVEPALQKSG